MEPFWISVGMVFCVWDRVKVSGLVNDTLEHS